MPTKIVPLNESAYTLITSKTNFILRVIGPGSQVQIRAQASLPAVDDVGLPLDPSKALTRLFDGDVYGISLHGETSVVVLESDS